MVDHSGSPIWFSGPHLGVTFDREIWLKCHPEIKSNERILADKAYNQYGIVYAFYRTMKMRLCILSILHAVYRAKRNCSTI